jgi:hypothetical protein
LTDSGTWDSCPVSLLNSTGAFANGDSVRVFFSRSGDLGATGPAGAAGAPGANGGTSFVLEPSSSTIVVATGSKTFVFTSPVVTPDTLGWDIGTRVRAMSAANPLNYMEGVVTAINFAFLPTRAVSATVLIDTIGGSGSHSDYTVSLAGFPGQGVPPGGTAGQELVKIDGTDFNTQWVTPASGADVLQVQVFS